MKGKKIKQDALVESIIGKIFSWNYGDRIRRGVFIKAYWKKDNSLCILYLDNMGGNCKTKDFILDPPKEFKDNEDCYIMTGRRRISDCIGFGDGFIYLDSDSYIPFL